MEAPDPPAASAQESAAQHPSPTGPGRSSQLGEQLGLPAATFYFRLGQMRRFLMCHPDLPTRQVRGSSPPNAEVASALSPYGPPYFAVSKSLSESPHLQNRPPDGEPHRDEKNFAEIYECTCTRRASALEQGRALVGTMVFGPVLLSTRPIQPRSMGIFKKSRPNRRSLKIA